LRSALYHKYGSEDDIYDTSAGTLVCIDFLYDISYQ